MDIIKNRLKTLELSDYILKVLTAIVFLTMCQIIFIKEKFFTIEYMGKMNPLFNFLIILVTFLFLFFLSNKFSDSIIFGTTSVVVACVSAYEAQNFTYTIGISLVLTGIIFYLYNNVKNIRINKCVSIFIIAILGILMALFIGLLTMFNYLRHVTPNYDMGIFSQMFYYMKETFAPLTTCERDGLLSHFAVHFSPIMYLILPFYFIFPSPITLLIAQGIIVALGIFPLVKLCKFFKLSPTITVFFTLIYSLFPTLIGANFYYFHENCFLPPLLLWLFYYAEKGNFKVSILFAFLVMFVKEDAPVYVAFFAIYLILSKKRIKLGIVLLISAIIYFLTVTTLMGAYGEGIMSNRYQNFVFGGENSLTTVIINIFTNPLIVFYESLTLSKFEFLLYMLMPLGFVPLMMKKPSGIILAFPMLLINLMSDYGYQHDISFQYSYASSVFLIYLGVINYSSFENKKILKKFMLSATATSMIFFAGTHAKKVNNFISYNDEKTANTEIFDALSLIPQDSSVKSTTFFVTPLSNRKEIYEINFTDRETDYIVLDLRYPITKLTPADFQNDDYEEVYFKENLIAIYKNKD